ncbi:MAG: hypothetical protein MJ237_06165 [bacterium]|nr:hypothetical protein [bacterium]
MAYKNDTKEMRNLMNDMKFSNITLKEDVKLDFRFTHGKVSYSNPISLYFSKNGFDKGKLNEGLIKTYPIDTTIKWLCDYFMLKKNQVTKCDGENGKQLIFVRIPNISNNVELLNQAIGVCGYHLSIVADKTIINDVEWLTLQYEENIQEDDSAIIRQQETHLYHITPQYNEKKIKDTGFSPRCRNTLFKYPERIYFMRGSLSEDEIIFLSEQLCNYNKSVGNNFKYCIFDVDINKIPIKTKMFLDSNYPGGIYITDNLRPECINRVGYIDLNEQDKIIKWC